MAECKIKQVLTGGGIPLRTKIFDPQIDVSKGILIFFVVLGHYLELCGNNPSRLYLHNAIYLFHMPMFIAISGYLSKAKKPKTFWNQQVKLLETYFVFQTIHYLPWLGMEQHSLINYFIFSEWTLWYIPSLIVWRTIIQYYGKSIKNNIYPVLSICLFASLLAGYIPLSKEFNIPRIISFLPFFLGGYVFRELKQSGVYNIGMKISFLIAVISIPIFIFDIEGQKWNNNFSCASNYYELNELYTGAFIRFAYFCSAILLIYITARISKIINTNQILTWAGRNSLLIYMLHSIIIMITAHFIGNNSIIAITMSIMTLLLIFPISKLSIHFILNPISSLLRR